MSIAVVDFGSPSAPVEVAHSLHETGFVVLKNHPISSELVASIYDEWDRFFSSEAKFKYPYSPERQDGYFARPVAGEGSTGGAKVHGRDDKEFFHIFPWGRVPAEVSDGALRYRSLAASLGAKLLGWLDENTPDAVAATFGVSLSRAVAGGDDQTLLRILRYPPLVAEPVREARRAGAHRDTNLLTILADGSAPGFEVRLRGSWCAVPWDGSGLVVNGGAMLEMLSGGYYPSVSHRVVPTRGVNDARPRLAMPLFLHPAPDVVVDGVHTAAEYLETRRLAIYVAEPGSRRD
jgi:isopenicillin N synthase-like dioxygenase